MSLSLQGRCVIVTRPAHQAGPLCVTLQAAGADVIRLPLIAIRPLPLASLNDSGDYDWLIFTSPNAVHHGLAGLGRITSRLAAVGAATARALETSGHAQVLLPPEDYSSEGLLDCPELKSVTGRRILLVKGRGGRRLLAERLRERGAIVSERRVYERQPQELPADSVAQAVAQADSVIVTSEQILQRLVDICPRPALAQLRKLQLVVPSERVVKRARELGFGDVLSVSSPLTETALVHALQRTHPASAE